MKRRNFVKHTSLGMMLIALHPESCFSDIKTADQKMEQTATRADLIENIRLLTSTSLQEMKTFYSQKMGLPIGNESNTEITFIAGQSSITFIKIDPKDGNPWYHFAFNIPENKLIKAREWQLRYSQIIPSPKSGRDPKYPDDVRHFRHWNAHSIFFWDPAGNLLEYIARHDLNNKRDGAFTTQDILNVSEIAFVVDDQEKEAQSIHTHIGLDVYPKNTDFWWAMGDEQGLLLCIPKRIWGENTPNPKRFSIFETQATIRGLKDKKYTFSNYPYAVKMNRHS